MRTFLFLLSGYADIDHIAPMIWKCLSKADQALVLFDRSYSHEKDFRIRFLMDQPGFTVQELWGVRSRRRTSRTVGKLIWNSHTLRRWLVRHNISACFFEWGEGLVDNRLVESISRLRQNMAEWQIKKNTGFQTSFRNSPLVKEIETLFLRPLRTQLIRA
ncbi:MAG: hypothetical protein ACRD1R_07375, partial [Acidobacteriota bacterium]